MRPPLTVWQLERRRRLAVQLLKGGKTKAAVARAVSASPSSVALWWKAYRRKGAAGLASRPSPGRPPRLSRGELRRLEQLLLKGPLAMGFRSDIWTLPRIARVIGEHFDVHYHPGHVWRILRESLGWSVQKPERRARERDEEAIERWRRNRWPHIKKRRTLRSRPGLRG